MRPAPRQVGTETAEKLPTWIGRRPLGSLCGICLVQVVTETAEKFLTWIGRGSLAAFCGICLLQVGTEMAEKFLTWIGGRTCILPLTLHFL